MKIFDFAGGERIDIKKMLEEREPASYGKYEEVVADILEAVKSKGDEAVFGYTKQFDGADLDADTIKVTEDEFRNAYGKSDPGLIEIIKKAKIRIYDYHMKQKQFSWFDTDDDGTILGQKVTPMQRVGVYVPGGKAVYTSSVLMDVLPAVVAGVPEIYIVTPPGPDGTINPDVLVAADICGVKDVFKVGGAQAVAALAFGTESIPKVDKIVGPGNIFVALAKKSVYGHVSIDAIAGPSEVLVVADETANPVFVAADMLSQAEHDELASAVLVSTDKALAQKVEEELYRQTALLPRKDIAEKSLESFGAIIIVDKMEDALRIVNDIAPEHLEVCTKSPFELLPFIKNAGAIFMGDYTPEPIGDYMAGPNHVLPTNGTAKFFSPLSVDDFVKKSSILSFNRQSMLKLAKDVVAFAEAENLTAHANSVRVRMEEEKES